MLVELHALGFVFRFGWELGREEEEPDRVEDVVGFRLEQEEEEEEEVDPEPLTGRKEKRCSRRS